MQNKTKLGISKLENSAAFILLLLVMVLSLIFFFSNINADLTRAGEGRAAEIAREMLERGNFVLPTLNHVVHVQSLTKPPLYHWMLIMTAAPFDWANWAVRLTSVLSSLGAIWMTFLCGSRMFNFRAGVYAAAVLSTSILFLDNGSAARMDILFSFLILASVYCFWMAINSEPDAKWIWWFYILSGLGVLTKGPIGILFPALVAILLSWNNPEARSWRELKLGKGMLLFLVVVLPWYVLMYMTAPGKLGFNFLFGQLAHWWSGSSNVASSGGKSVTYYIPHLLVGLFPWSLLLPAAIIVGFRAVRRESDIAVKSLLIWFLGGLIIFSLGGKKAARYLLPIMSPFALIMGFYLDRIREDISSRHHLILKISTFFVAALAIVLAVFLIGILADNQTIIQWLSEGQKKGGASKLSAVISLFQTHPLEVVSVTIIMLLASFSALYGALSRKHWLFVFGLGAVVWSFVWPYALTVKPVLQVDVSPRNVAEEIAAMLPNDTVLHGGGKGYQHSMRWYMDRNIKIDYPKKLYNRVIKEPDSWVLLMEKKPLRKDLQKIQRDKHQWKIEYYYVTLFPGQGAHRDKK